MSPRSNAVFRVVWTGLFAVVFTGAVSAVWGALLTVNLTTSSAIPWAVVPMAIVLWAAWRFLGGGWGWRRTQAARQELLRSRRTSGPIFAWAVAAGALWMAALAGLWIVLHRLVAVQTNPLPDLSRYPAFTVVVALIAASVSGAVSEEAAFRGYFLTALERAGLGPFAVLIAALLMAPEHALTQGFVWPTMVFYLLFDGMQGAIAFVTRSIRPGIVVHAIGLFVFFYFVWPHDAGRTLISAHGADTWFWIHLAQILACGALSLGAFAHLARLANPRDHSADGVSSAPASPRREPSGLR